jgi:hypothetical protein
MEILNMQDSKKEASEKEIIFPTRPVPRLNLCASPKANDSPKEINSLTYRYKKRMQIHKSLDIRLSSTSLLSTRVVRADHTLLQVSSPKAFTTRPHGFGTTVTINNRVVAKNLLLDSFPA